MGPPVDFDLAVLILRVLEAWELRNKGLYRKYPAYKKPSKFQNLILVLGVRQTDFLRFFRTFYEKKSGIRESRVSRRKPGNLGGWPRARSGTARCRKLEGSLETLYVAQRGRPRTLIRCCGPYSYRFPARRPETARGANATSGKLRLGQVVSLVIPRSSHSCFQDFQPIFS